LEKIALASKGPLGTFNKFVSQAPMILVIVMEKPKMLTEMGGRLKKKEYPLIDIGIAAGQFCLQAAELGLGTCMLGWFDETKVKALLGIPEEKNVGLLITVGYAPADYPLRKKVRKSAEIVYRQNGYHQKP
jgi:nitroreductase